MVGYGTAKDLFNVHCIHALKGKEVWNHASKFKTKETAGVACNFCGVLVGILYYKGILILMCFFAACSQYGNFLYGTLVSASDMYSVK